MPDLFAGLLVGVMLDSEGLELLQENGELLPLAGNRAAPPIDLDDQVGIASRQGIRA